jgi:uncharacterized protein (DUF2126 family)
LWPERAETLFATLDPSTQKQLEMTEKKPVSALPKDRGTSSMKALMLQARAKKTETVEEPTVQVEKIVEPVAKVVEVAPVVEKVVPVVEEVAPVVEKPKVVKAVEIPIEEEVTPVVEKVAPVKKTVVKVI